jgi:hypothetical protein
MKLEAGNLIASATVEMSNYRLPHPMHGAVLTAQVAGRVPAQQKTKNFLFISTTAHSHTLTLNPSR